MHVRIVDCSNHNSVVEVPQFFISLGIEEGQKEFFFYSSSDVEAVYLLWVSVVQDKE